MSSVELPFPNRAVQMPKAPFALPAAFAFTVLIMSVLFVGLAIWQGPGLWRDIQISRNPQVLGNGRVLDGECSTRRGLTDCEARLVYDYNGQSYDKWVTLAFLDFSSSDYEVDVVISRDDPELATLSLGLDMLWNRLAVFAGFLLLFGGGAIAMLVTALHGRAANRAASAPGRLAAMPVNIAGINGRYVSYADPAKPRRMLRTRLEAGQAPLWAVDEAGKTMGVAVKAEHVALPILLDAGLERLDLSAAEREAALAAFAEQQAGRQPAPTQQKQARRNVARRLMIMLVSLAALFAVGVGGYWLYYVTSAPDAFDSLGMEINNVMPGPLNLWGCAQLETRFGDGNAPFGCTADDYVSWKHAARTKVK